MMMDCMIISVILSKALNANKSRDKDGACDLLAAGIERPEMTLDEARISGSGTISRNKGSTTPGQIVGQIDLSVDGLTLADENLAAAAGTTLAGTLGFDWAEGEPLELTGIDLDGAGITIGGDMVSGCLAAMRSRRCSALVPERPSPRCTIPITISPTP